MKLYGLLAQFENANSLLAAAQKTYDHGYRVFDAYTPYPIDGLAEATGFRRTRVPLITLLGALGGAAGAYYMQYFANVQSYPLNIGGRPWHSWPAFIPVSFELTILGGAISAVFGMFILNGLPRPYHPLFNCDAFARASTDGFFLCIQSTDPIFDLEATTRFFKSLEHEALYEVQP